MTPNTHRFDLLRRRIPALACAALLTIGQLAATAYAAETHRVSQKSRSFNLKEITVAAGDSVEFANDDEFIHQVYVDNKAFNFDTAESAPGNVLAIKFTTPGTYQVHCHIHPKMSLTVNVQ